MKESLGAVSNKVVDSNVHTNKSVPQTLHQLMDAVRLVETKILVH